VINVKDGFYINQSEIEGVLRNLEIVSNVISVKAAITVSAIALDLLANAQPRVPYDTGELRRSGKAVLVLDGAGDMIIGVGSEDGTILAMLSKLSAERIKKARSISAYVQYIRYNDKGEDIALKMHEELNPYGHFETPRARYPGTSGKYLEAPFNERYNKYLNIIQGNFSSLPEDLRKIAKRRSVKGLGSFTVDLVDLNPNFSLNIK
jgi:hypothetical protein